MKPFVTSTISAPGFFGLNTQDSSIELAEGYSLIAQNCVIDRFGRIGSRKGWTPVNTTVNTDLGSANPVEFIFEVEDNGNTTVISGGNNKLFTGTTTMTTVVIKNADNTGTATYTITGNDWQAAAIPFGDGVDAITHAYLVQAGHKPLVYHELPTAGGAPHDHDSGTYGFQLLSDVGTLPPGHDATSFTPNCTLAAYGRIWMADVGTDNQTVYFSRLLDGSDFSGGDSGFLSLNSVFPNNDSIVAIAAHNGYLIIFGRNNIAIYANPLDVTQLELAEFIPNVGCIARDSVQATGTDIIFLSDAGVRSLQRVIQEKSLPFRDLSKNVRDFLLDFVAVETPAKIRSVYFDREAFYLLTMPSSNMVFCFDTRATLQDGSARVTTWESIDPKALSVTSNKELYIGKPGYIGKYNEYSDNGTSYRLKYFSTYFTFDQPTLLKILKKIGFVLIGGSNNVAVKYSFDYSSSYRSQTKTLIATNISEYNTAEYGIAEFTTGISIAKFSINPTGNGAVIQLGLESDINGSSLSIQKIDVGVKQGKTII